VQRRRGLDHKVQLNKTR